jgi:16S rRNA G966 N2-methylase RsmD
LDDLQAIRREEPTSEDHAPPDNNHKISHALVVEDYPMDYEDKEQQYAIGLQSLQVKPERGSKKQKQQRLIKQGKPWFVEFTTSTKRKGNDLLTKAVSPCNCHVVDLTAGWGQDAWQFIQAGKATYVTMVERNPIVATLVRDGLRRLSIAQSSNNILHLREGDGIQVATEMMTTRQNTTTTTTDDHPLPPAVDIVYLDPMFPTRTKSAAVKKPMQILHALLDTQNENSSSATENDNVLQQRLLQEQTLLQTALRLAHQRVVVKRPIHAPYLGTTTSGTETTTTYPYKPSYQIHGSINRWDVYQCSQDS